MIEITTLMVKQSEQSNWCWAAVGQGVDLVHGTTTTQCAIANLVLQPIGPDCCVDCGSCNVPQELEDTLNAISHFSGSASSPALPATIVTETTSGNPVCVRLSIVGQSVGHFVAIKAICGDGDNPWLLVCDPDPTEHALPMSTNEYWTQYSTLISGFLKGAGTWDMTFFTT